MSENEEFYTESDPFGAYGPITAGAFPIDPPGSWFENPNLTGPTPLTVEDDGRVYGHVAAWGTKHIGMPGSIDPPRSRSNYSFYRTGVLRTAEGDDVHVGQLTMAGGHAQLSADAGSAVKHYDDTASAVADLAAGEDDHGIWVSGAMRPSATAEQVRVLRASAPSGDWREINGGLEMVAVLQVNVPGFPLARARVASGATMSLVAAGASEMLMTKFRQVDGDTPERLASLEAMVASLMAAENSRIKESLRTRVHG